MSELNFNKRGSLGTIQVLQVNSLLHHLNASTPYFTNISKTLFLVVVLIGIEPIPQDFQSCAST